MNELAILVRNERHPDAVDLGVMGPITHETASALRGAVRGVMHADPSTPCPQLLLDLTCCTNVDIDGLLALAVCQQAARDDGGDLYLEHVPPLVERQIRQHNFDHLLHDPSAGDLTGSPADRLGPDPTERP